MDNMQSLSHKRISVVIPTFNRASLLRATVDSLTKSTLSRDYWDLTVVDDGSTDDTYEVVRSYADTCDIKYVWQPDAGFRLARARNLGLRLAENDRVVIVDCGVVLHSRALEVASRWNGRSSEDQSRVGSLVGYVYGFANDQANDVRLAQSVDLTKIDLTIDRFMRARDFFDVRERVYEQCRGRLSQLPAPWAIAWGCLLVVDRTGMRNKVLYDEEFRSWGGEDLDFGLTLTSLGVAFELDRNLCGIHLPHSKGSAESTASSKLNKAYLHRKWRLAETEMLVNVQSVDLNALLAQRS